MASKQSKSPKEITLTQEQLVVFKNWFEEDLREQTTAITCTVIKKKLIDLGNTFKSPTAIQIHEYFVKNEIQHQFIENKIYHFQHVVVPKQKAKPKVSYIKYIEEFNKYLEQNPQQVEIQHERQAFTEAQVKTLIEQTYEQFKPLVSAHLDGKPYDEIISALHKYTQKTLFIPTGKSKKSEEQKLVRYLYVGYTASKLVKILQLGPAQFDNTSVNAILRFLNIKTNQGIFGLYKAKCIVKNYTELSDGDTITYVRKPKTIKKVVKKQDEEAKEEQQAEWIQPQERQQQQQQINEEQDEVIEEVKQEPVIIKEKPKKETKKTETTAKTVAKTEVKPEVKTVAKTEVKPVTKPEVKPETKQVAQIQKANSVSQQRAISKLKEVIQVQEQVDNDEVEMDEEDQISEQENEEEEEEEDQDDN